MSQPSSETAFETGICSKSSVLSVFIRMATHSFNGKLITFCYMLEITQRGTSRFLLHIRTWINSHVYFLFLNFSIENSYAS